MAVAPMWHDGTNSAKGGARRVENMASARVQADLSEFPSFQRGSHAVALDAADVCRCRTMAPMRFFYGDRPFAPGVSRSVIVFIARRCGPMQVSPS
jgi:hypothetical protein